MSYTYYKGAKGFLITVLQQALLDSGMSLPHGADGVYGDETTHAVAEFLRSAPISQDLRDEIVREGGAFGKAGEHVFGALRLTLARSGLAREASQIAWPGLFARCLLLTMAFEGTGFTGAVGERETSDTAGVTFGAIGFTSDKGELQELVREALEMHPNEVELIARRYLTDFERLFELIAKGSDAKLFEAWACDENRSVREPVKAFFKALGSLDWFKNLQMKWAYDRYFSKAMRQVAALFGTKDAPARAYALLFDIAVQNGGLSVRSSRIRD
jgi:hypothetical protein